MIVEKKINGETLTLIPQGMIDTSNAPSFEDAVDAAITEAKNLEIDFSNVEYIASSGLRVLLNAYKKKASIGKMSLTNVNATVKDVLTMTGFSKIFTIL